MPQEYKSLAEKIVALIEAEKQSIAPSSLEASLDRINQRLEKLEQTLLNETPPPPKNEHPSLHKFNVAESIVDELFAGLEAEKACRFEPGKPCDHCSMCNSRGF